MQFIISDFKKSTSQPPRKNNGDLPTLRRVLLRLRMPPWMQRSSFYLLSLLALYRCRDHHDSTLRGLKEHVSLKASYLRDGCETGFQCITYWDMGLDQLSWPNGGDSCKKTTVCFMTNCGQLTHRKKVGKYLLREEFPEFRYLNNSLDKTLIISF